jgi:hypothetical protein
MYVEVLAEAQERGETRPRFPVLREPMPHNRGKASFRKIDELNRLVWFLPHLRDGSSPWSRWGASTSRSLFPIRPRRRLLDEFSRFDRASFLSLMDKSEREGPDPAAIILWGAFLRVTKGNFHGSGFDISA